VGRKTGAGDWGLGAGDWGPGAGEILMNYDLLIAHCLPSKGQVLGTGGWGNPNEP